MPLTILLLTLPLAFLPACTGGSDDASEIRVTKGEAATVLQRANLDDPATIDDVDEIRDSDAAVEAARDLLASGAEGGPRWAATYVYANAGEDPAPLRPLLDDPDPAIRVMAGAALVARGDATGFDALVDGLAHEELMPGSDPPSPVWTFAAGALARYTGRGDLGPPFDADPHGVSRAYDRWVAWLEDNGDSLGFDANSGLWRAT